MNLNLCSTSVRVSFTQAMVNFIPRQLCVPRPNGRKVDCMAVSTGHFESLYFGKLCCAVVNLYNRYPCFTLLVMLKKNFVKF